MTRFLLFLIICIVFSCGEKSVKNNSVETIKNGHNPKRETQQNELGTEGTIDSHDPLTFWDTVELKVNKFIKGKTLHREGKHIPQDFTDFYKQFISDSTFQVKHIDFANIIGAYSECDTLIQITSKNWIYTNWNTLDEFNKKKRSEPIDGWDNRLYFDNKSIYFQLVRPEVGMISRLGFEKINGEWELTLYVLYNC